ncbi:signal peptidase I [Actinoplanes subglobosus]|uniref:Signal peptidase I n=1 Tax=Actinoplanes subglobosus TaxID=1547892 RepID=A0ABV8ITQ7_9ACTN
MYGRRLHIARSAALAAGLVMLLASTGWFLLRYRVYAIPTVSMAPLITPGDRVVVDTWSQDAASGDVVLLDGENLLLKRVAATGGETITCCGDASAITTGQVTVGTGTTPFTVRIPAGRLFVLGDNAAASLDSRAAAGTPSAADGDGTLPTTQVRGRAVAVISPAHQRLLPDRAAATLTRTGMVFAAGLVLLLTAALLTLRSSPADG